MKKNPVVGGGGPHVLIDGRLPRGFRLTRAELARAARYFARRSAARAGLDK
jgi:hypothetical protein